jgi:hypothetical protein
MQGVNTMETKHLSLRCGPFSAVVNLYYNALLQIAQSSQRPQGEPVTAYQDIAFMAGLLAAQHPKN